MLALAVPLSMRKPLYEQATSREVNSKKAPVYGASVTASTWGPSGSSFVSLCMELAERVYLLLISPGGRRCRHVEFGLNTANMRRVMCSFREQDFEIRVLISPDG